MTEPGKAPTVSIVTPELRFRRRPMPMSEEERRLLKELELGLIAEDPHLAMELLSGYPSRRFRPGILYGSAAGLLGLALLIAGTGNQVIGLAIAGGLLMVLGVCLALGKRTFHRRAGRGRRHNWRGQAG